jgi:Right handed beta helix region
MFRIGELSPPTQEVNMKKNTCRLLGVFLCLVIFAANSNAQTITIDSDTVWATGTGPYTQTNIIISNATLTIEPGVVVKFNDAGLLKVHNGGRIMATGATFTWANGVNEWHGIQFVEGDSRSRLEGCVIEHASGYDSINARAMVFVGGTTSTTYPAPTIIGCTIGNGTAMRGIHVSNSRPQILNNTISEFISIPNYTGFGIFVTGGSAPLVAGNLITGNSRGIGIYSGAAGLYRANRIQGNADYGIYNNNLSSYPNIDARYNWWGNASGPQPSGTGDLINSKVDYSPWATSITDSEPDGMWDEWEMGQFGNLATANVTSDTDLDGLLDKDEFLYGTDPNDKDSDGDGVWDGLEVLAGMNPTLAGDFGFDGDDDGYSNLREIVAGTDPWDDASIPPVLADGNSDGDVDGKDIAGLIAEFGSTGCSGCKYDLDIDGDVDLADLFLFSEDFGRTTP